MLKTSRLLGVSLVLCGAVACSSSKKVAEMPAAPAAKAPESAQEEEKKDDAMNVSAVVPVGEEKAPNFGPVYFDFDSSDFQPGTQETLQNIAKYMSEHAAVVLTIGGHSDERGTSEYNLALADRRAATARDYLVRLGVDVSRIKVISYGEEQPAMTGEGEDVWAKNRRDEFQVAGH
jgi:peptidoglycan-associated lipoprotein